MTCVYVKINYLLNRMQVLNVVGFSHARAIFTLGYILRDPCQLKYLAVL